MDFSDIIMLLSGVALFLFGMSVMGDGLQKSSGNSRSGSRKADTEGWVPWVSRTLLRSCILFHPDETDNPRLCRSVRHIPVSPSWTVQEYLQIPVRHIPADKNHPPKIHHRSNENATSHSDCEDMDWNHMCNPERFPLCPTFPSGNERGSGLLRAYPTSASLDENENPYGCSCLSFSVTLSRHRRPCLP